MKEFIVTKKYSATQDIDPDEIDDVNELDRFNVKRVKSNSKDLTSQIDTDLEFEDDYELAVYLAKVFKEDPDNIEIVEDESTIQYSGA